MVMLEQLKTVNQSELVEYIGFVDSEYLLRNINYGLKKALGLWVENHRNIREIFAAFAGNAWRITNQTQIML